MCFHQNILKFSIHHKQKSWTNPFCLINASLIEYYLKGICFSFFIPYNPNNNALFCQKILRTHIIDIFLLQFKQLIIMTLSSVQAGLTVGRQDR